MQEVTVPTKAELRRTLNSMQWDFVIPANSTLDHLNGQGKVTIVETRDGDGEELGRLLQNRYEITRASAYQVGVITK